MKTMKKVFALVLALIMVMSLGLSVVADDTTSTATIKISNAVCDQTYRAYKIFDAVTTGTGNDMNASYSISSNDAWWTDVLKYIGKGTAATADEKGVYAGNGLTLTPINGTITYMVTADEISFNAADFAKYLNEHKDGKTATSTAKAAAKADDAADNKTSVEIPNLPLGYYFVDTTLGTLCGLVTTGTAFEAIEKNSEPTVEKEVEEDTDNAWGEKNSADLGQTVNFKTTVTVNKGSAANVTLHDKMTGLTLTDGTIKVTYGGKEATASTDYTVKTTNLDDDCSFEIDFADDFVTTVLGNADSATIVVEYAATVNKDAVIEGEGNPNETYLKYGENKDVESTHDTTTTYVYKFNVDKIDGTSKEALAGAKFKLYRGENEYAEFTVDEEANTYTFNSWVTKDYATELVSSADEDMKMKIVGLDLDTYYIEETVAPAGYNPLTAPVKVVLTATETTGPDGKVTTAGTLTVHNDKTGQDVEVNNLTATIENNQGSTLPETGGIGTTIFYVVGGIMMLAAVVVLVTMKKMNAKSER